MVKVEGFSQVNFKSLCLLLVYQLIGIAKQIFIGFRKKNAMIKKELEDAAKDMRGLSPDSVPLNSIGPVLLCGALPSNPSIKFVRFGYYNITGFML